MQHKVMMRLIGVCFWMIYAEGDLLPVNTNSDSSKSKPITIWPLSDAEKMHFHSPEMASALPILLDKSLPVIDLGCGVGYYVNELSKLGYSVHAVEGTEGIENISLYRPILQADLSEPLALDLPRGNVMSFEVAEHLHIDDEDVFLYNLASYCTSRLLLSWALPEACAPGRGHGHLNCRDNAYVVRALFQRGFLFQSNATAWLRQVVKHSEAFWFRDTVMIFDRNLPLASLGSLKSLPTSRDQVASAPAKLYVEENNGRNGACRGGLMKPLEDEFLVTSRNEAIDVEVTVTLADCHATDGSPMCFLLYIDDNLELTACPTEGHASSLASSHVLYGIPPGTFEISVIPCTASGAINLDGTYSQKLTVIVSERDAVQWEDAHSVLQVLAGKADRLRQGLRDAVQGEDVQHAITNELIEQAEGLRHDLRMLQSGLLEGEREEMGGKGVGVGRLEALLGLDSDMVDEIVNEVKGNIRLATVLNGESLQRKTSTQSRLQDIYIRLHHALFNAQLLPMGGLNIEAPS